MSAYSIENGSVQFDMSGFRISCTVYEDNFTCHFQLCKMPNPKNTTNNLRQLDKTKNQVLFIYFLFSSVYKCWVNFCLIFQTFLKKALKVHLDKEETQRAG